MENPVKQSETKSRLCGQCWLSTGKVVCSCDGTDHSRREVREEQLDFFETEAPSTDEHPQLN